mgnify:CR=1 FL=1
MVEGRGDLLVGSGILGVVVPAIYRLYLDGGFVKLMFRTKVQMSLSAP